MCNVFKIIEDYFTILNSNLVVSKQFCFNTNCVENAVAVNLGENIQRLPFNPDISLVTEDLSKSALIC